MKTGIQPLLSVILSIALSVTQFLPSGLTQDPYAETGSGSDTPAVDPFLQSNGGNDEGNEIADPASEFENDESPLNPARKPIIMSFPKGRDIYDARPEKDKQKFGSPDPEWERDPNTGDYLTASKEYDYVTAE